MVYKVMINLSTWLLLLLVRKLQHREHKYNYKFTVIISLHKHSFSKLSNNPQSSFTNILSMQVMQKRIIYVHKLTLNAFKFCKTLHDGHFASWLIFISKIIIAFQFSIVCYKILLLRAAICIIFYQRIFICSIDINLIWVKNNALVVS